MFSINAQFDINTKNIWKGWVNIWGGCSPPSPPYLRLCWQGTDKNFENHRRQQFLPKAQNSPILIFNFHFILIYCNFLHRFSCVVVGILLLIGTVLDMVLERKKFCRDGCRKNFKYDNYTYAVNPPLQPYSDNIKVEVDGCMTGTGLLFPFHNLNMSEIRPTNKSPPPSPLWNKNLKSANFAII